MKLSQQGLGTYKEIMNTWNMKDYLTFLESNRG